MRLIYLVSFLAVALTVSCGSRPPTATNGSRSASETLTVSAAVSLKDAFEEIAAIYEARSGNHIAFNFGASGALQRQIEAGAPVDVFASAGERQMDELVKKGLVDESTRRDFARNTLVLIVPSGSSLSLTRFEDLANDQVERIAIGNPKTVPAGQYTDQLLSRINGGNSIRAKLILGEHVRQVLDYVVRGEVDAGVVYATDARIAGDKVKIAATAAAESHDPILYPIAILKDAEHKRPAREFADLVSSPEGQEILKKFGFGGIGQ